MPDRHPTARQRRDIGRAAALVLAATAAAVAFPAAAVAAELPVQVSFAASPAEPSGATTHTWTVPAGVSEVTFYAAGGAGGAGGNGGGVGGGGGSAEVNLAVTPGQTFTITVGGNGADGAAPQLGDVAAGGAGGGPSGGRGGDGGSAQLSTTGVLGGGGGAGGASSVSLPAGGETALVLVAPGGGGGGAGSGTATSSGQGAVSAGSPSGALAPSTASGAAPGSGGGSDSNDPGTSGVVGGVGGSGGMPGTGAGTAGGGGAGTATQGGAGGLGTPPGIAGSASGGAAGPAGSGAGGGGDGFFGGGSGGGSTAAAGGGGGGGFYVSPDATDFAQLSPSNVGAVSIGYSPPPPPPPTPPAPPQPPAPHPVIVGTPASGQPLTCLPTSAIGGETFTYRWLRDLAPVTGASGPTYDAGPVDAGHYLQCVVTGTSVGGSVSGTSSFVAVPIGGTPASVSRSSITAAARGDAARVVVRCSPRAAGACTISLLLSLVETVQRGGHVVAVSARLATSSTHGRRSPRPPRTTRRTVIVGSVPVTLGPGEVLVVPVPLNALGRLLLAREHHLPVLVSANGTLIGAVSASLGSRLLTLHPTGAPPATHSVSAASAPAVLAATPYMGWDTYFAFGGAFNEATILDQAHQLIARGLARAGYRYIWFDVGWWHGTRDASGQITIDPTQWPHGLAWLTGILHQAGLLVGLYTDAGSSGCGGPGAGSYGHYQQDANTFAAWGFDAVKVDFCGGVRQGLDPQSTYTAFHNAIVDNASQRPMLLSVCNFLQPGQFATGTPDLAGSGFNSWAFGPSIANSWRTDTDIGTPHHVDFANVLRNLDADAAHPQAAGPGHWNDPDYLGPDQGLSATAYRTQLSMWSMLAAPLMISDDLDTMSAQSASDSANPEVIAIDQDPAGVQGTLVASAGEAEVWVKPLSDGSRAVALLNRGNTPVRIAATALGVGLPRAARYTVRDVWTHRTSTTTSAISALVPAEGTALYRISALPAPGRP